MTNFVTSFVIFEKNKVRYFMNIVCQQTFLIIYHVLFVIFEKKTAKIESFAAENLGDALRVKRTSYFS